MKHSIHRLSKVVTKTLSRILFWQFLNCICYPLAQKFKQKSFFFFLFAKIMIFFFLLTVCGWRVLSWSRFQPISLYSCTHAYLSRPTKLNGQRRIIGKANTAAWQGGGRQNGMEYCTGGERRRRQNWSEAIAGPARPRGEKAFNSLRRLKK